MFVVKVHNLDDVFLVDEVGFCTREDAALPHLVDAKTYVLPTVYSHEDDVIVPRGVIRDKYLLWSRALNLECLVELFTQVMSWVIQLNEYRSSILVI